MYQTLTADSQRQKTKNTCGKILGNIGLFLLVFLAAVPVLWLIYLSLKSNTDILTNPLALPDTLHWENYVNAYKTIPFYSMVKNTGIVILISVPVSMLLSIFAAFALGRMRFGSGKVQNGVYSYFVCGVIMPTCVMILPIYLVMVKVGLYDTLWSTILTHIGWTAPMNMMIMVSGFRSIPDSLEEAAIIEAKRNAMTLGLIYLLRSHEGGRFPVSTAELLEQPVSMLEIEASLQVSVAAALEHLN